MRLVTVAILCLAACGREPATQGPQGAGGSGGAGGDGGSGGSGDLRLFELSDLPSVCSSPDGFCTKTIVPHAGGIALGRDCKVCETPPPVHLLDPVNQRVVVLDRTSGDELGDADSLGLPSALAVSLDGSVWVANGDNLAHLDPAGTPLCRAPVPSAGAVAVAVDPQTGDAWVGDAQGNVTGFDRSAVLPAGADGILVCQPLGTNWSADFPVMALAMDDRGVTWAVAGMEIARNGPITGITHLELDGPATRVAIDPGTHDAWFDGDGVQLVLADPPYAGSYDHVGITACGTGIVARSADVWCADENDVTQVDRATLEPIRGKVLEEAVSDVIDVNPLLWILLPSGSIGRLDPTAFTRVNFPARYGLVGAGDPTGQRMVDFPALRGVWEDLFDAGSPSTWTSVEWTAEVPPGAAVVAGMVFAQRREDLAGQKLTCFSDTGSLDLAGCAGSSGARFALLVLQLRTSPSGDAPSVSKATVSLTTP